MEQRRFRVCRCATLSSILVAFCPSPLFFSFHFRAHLRFPAISRVAGDSGVERGGRMGGGRWNRGREAAIGGREMQIENLRPPSEGASARKLGLRENNTSRGGCCLQLSSLATGGELFFSPYTAEVCSLHFAARLQRFHWSVLV